jgi:peptide/nickel transport system substrate-binding protein
LLKSDRPFAPFIGNLCSPVGGFLSPKAIETYGKEIAQRPVGTGRFKLREWRPREKMVLVRNDEYWGKKVKLNELILRPIPEEGTRAMAFESGEIDVIHDALPHRIAEYKKNPKINVITGPATRMVWVGFNYQDKVLRNLKLRRAIAHAINREEIVEHVLEGLGINAQEIIPPVIMKFDKKYKFDYDPEKAKKLLKEAGYPNGLELNMWTPEGRYLKDRQIAEAVQAQLAQIGIKTKLRVMEWGAYMDAVFRHEQQIYIVGWGFGAGDPDPMLRACFHSASKFNWSNYYNPAMNKLLDIAVSTLDPDKRLALYSDIQEVLIEEAAVVPIYHKMNIYAAHKNVENFYPHPTELIDVSETAVK